MRWNVMWLALNIGSAIWGAAQGRHWLPLINAFIAGSLTYAIASELIQGRERERAPKEIP